MKMLQALGSNQRNYAEIQITIEPEFSVIAQLKVILIIQMVVAKITMVQLPKKLKKQTGDCYQYVTYQSCVWRWFMIEHAFQKIKISSILRALFVGQAVSSNMYKITDWMSEEEEDDEDWRMTIFDLICKHVFFYLCSTLWLRGFYSRNKVFFHCKNLKMMTSSKGHDKINDQHWLCMINSIRGRGGWWRLKSGYIWLDVQTTVFFYLCSALWFRAFHSKNSVFVHCKI